MKPSSTTPLANDDRPTFEVTHEFHPLYQQHLALVDLRQTWGEDRVYYYDHRQRLCSLPACWTTVGKVNPYQTLATGRSYFDPLCLVEMVQQIAALKEQLD